MPQATQPDHMRGRLSLPVRLTVLILFAALVPLAAVVGINTYRARQALTDQGQARLASDATAKATLVDTYIYERMLDGQALAALPTAQDYLACAQRSALTAGLPSAMAAYVPVLTAVMRCDDPLYNKASSLRALAVGVVRDNNYAGWSMYDASLNLLISSSASTPAVDKEDSDGLKQGGSYISNVHFAPGQGQQPGHAYLFIYTPITLVLSDLAGQVSLAAQSGLLPLSQSQVAQLTQALKAIPGPRVGYLRSTLNLDYVWSIVGHEQDANGDGSDAFIADRSGVRIASGIQSELFTAVKPLDPAVAQAIQSEKRFGSATAPTVVDLPDVASSLDDTNTQQTFQSIASPDSTTQYQFVRIRLDKLSLDRSDAAGKAVSVPLQWSYFVLSPTATVTQIATDQEYYSLFSAAIIAVLAILIGLYMGSRITRPVQRSVAELEGAAVRLNTLASHQQHSSSEQHWVVDACQTGLDSVRYLSDAMHQAAKRVIEASNWFGDYWDRLTEEQARRTVQHLQELAHYIEEAARRQQASSDRLGKAITVTRQVSDQLVSGASAATESADQLQLVVRDLHHVVGGRARQALGPDTVGAPQEELPGGMPGMVPGMGPGMAPGISQYPGISQFPGNSQYPGISQFPGNSQYPGISQYPQYGSGVYRPDPRQPVGARTPRNNPSGWGEYDPGLGGYGGFSGFNGQNNGRAPRLPNPPSVWGPPGAWGDR